MKHLFTILFVVACTTVSLAQLDVKREMDNQISPDHVFLPASHVAMIHPNKEEFTMTRLPRGFYNKQKSVGFSVIEIHAPFNENNEEDYKKIEGLGRMLVLDNYIINGMKARYKIYEMEGPKEPNSAEKPNAVIMMSMEIQGEGDLLYVIHAAYPTREEAKYRTEFEKTMLSVVIDKNRDIDFNEGMPFVIAYESTPFKPENTTQNIVFSLTPEGKSGDENPENTRLLIGTETANLEHAALSEYLATTIKTLPNAATSKMENITPAIIANLEGFEVTGARTDEQGKTTNVYAAVISSGETVLSMLCESTDTGQMEQMKQLLKSLKIKK